MAQRERYWGYCLYMPCEVHFWGSLLPDCYIVTNISMLCLGKKCVCARAWACPSCAREHSDTSLGNLSSTLQCKYDYTEISTVPTEASKQYSLHFTNASYPLLSTSSEQKWWACGSVALQLRDKQNTILSIWHLIPRGWCQSLSKALWNPLPMIVAVKSK